MTPSPSFEDLEAQAIDVRKRGNPDEIARFHRRVMSAFPDHAGYAANAADELLTLGRAFDAAALIKSALESRPNTPKLLQQLSRVFKRMRSDIEDAVNRNHPDDIARYYRRLVDAFPERKEVAVAAADAMTTLGRWSDAVTILKSALEYAPTSPGLLSRIAKAYIDLGNHGQAIPYLKRLTDRAPDDGMAWINLGQTQAAASDWAAAERSFDRAFALMPKDVSAALGYGDTLFENAKSKEAVAAYRHASSEHPSSADALSKLGGALLATGDHKGAEDALRRSIAINPNITVAHVNLAATLHYRGEFNEAITACQKALALDWTSGIAHYTLGLILIDIGQIPEGAAAHRLSVKYTPNCVKGLLALASAEMLLENKEAADLALQRILIIEPKHAEARHLLAALHGEPVTGVPEGYSEKLFDWFAGRFDKHLLEVLKYRTPQDTADLLKELRPDASAFKRFLDIGCGTGLVATAVGKEFRIPDVTGVDIAQRMVETARQKGVYTRLVHGDITADLPGVDGPFDLISAIDVMPYLGDLSRLMEAVARRLEPNGLFLYSHEAFADGGYKLMPFGRFAHSASYIEETARRAGLELVTTRTVTLRTERGKPAVGGMGAMRRVN